MRVVITGATGNVGTSLTRVLTASSGVDEVVGVARRPPDEAVVGARDVEWVEADVAVDDLAPIVDGADAVVHLAWLIQPSRDQRAMWATNVVGTRRVVEAVARTGVRSLVVASSVGAYSPALTGEVVDESWPTDGIPESTYSWQKALIERTLDALEAQHPSCRVVRIRSALIFKRESARHVRNLFIGHLLPQRLIPVEATMKAIERLPIPFQVVHADDVADAIRRSVLTDVAGAFNLAAPGVLGRTDGNRERSARLLRPLVATAWRARLVPVDPGWISLATSVPLMSTERATTELGWVATLDARAVVRELLGGLRDDASGETPPLEERALDDDAVTAPAVSA